jgi:hypothetical protein
MRGFSEVILAIVFRWTTVRPLFDLLSFELILAEIESVGWSDEKVAMLLGAIGSTGKS